MRLMCLCHIKRLFVIYLSKNFLILKKCFDFYKIGSISNSVIENVKYFPRT